MDQDRDVSRRDLLSMFRPTESAPPTIESGAGIGRRDLLSIFMWIVAALIGRWKIPAQLAPAAELVDRVIGPQIVETGRTIFKGGTMKITMMIKGWEMPEGWRQFMSTPEFASAVMGATKEEKSDDSIAAG